MINLPSFHPFFVLKLEVRALLQNVCNGICGLVASKNFSGEDALRHPYDSRAFSARSRTNYFNATVKTNKLDVLAVCKTHLSSTFSNRQIQINGYRTIRRGRLDGRKGGGCVVYVSKELTGVHLKHLEHDGIEAIWLRIVTKSCSLVVGTFYRSPNNMAFFQDIVYLLEKAWLKYKNLILLGDLNVNFSKTASITDRALQDKFLAILTQFDCSVVNILGVSKKSIGV